MVRLGGIISSEPPLVLRKPKTNSSYQGICIHLCSDFINFYKFDAELLSRTSIHNSFGMGSSLRFLRLFSSNEFHNKCKAVPHSVANAESLDPLYCKGLFTTLAITNNPIERLSESLIVQKVTSAITSFHKKFMVWLLDRNSKSGLIGVGLASCLRTIS